MKINKITSEKENNFLRNPESEGINLNVLYLIIEARSNYWPEERRKNRCCIEDYMAESK